MTDELCAVLEAVSSLLSVVPGRPVDDEIFALRAAHGTFVDGHGLKSSVGINLPPGHQCTIIGPEPVQLPLSPQWWRCLEQR